MKPIKTSESNCRLTLPGGTIDTDLPATRCLLFNSDAGQTEADGAMGFVTTWMPTEAEARQLDAGGMVQLSVWGPGHPPVAISVTPGVMPERELITRGHVDCALGHLYADLQRRVCDALKQAIRDHATMDDIALGYENVGAEVVGVPAPAAFADLWAAAVEQTLEAHGHTGLRREQAPDDPGGLLDIQTVPAPPHEDCTAPDRACPTPDVCLNMFTACPHAHLDDKPTA